MKKSLYVLFLIFISLNAYGKKDINVYTYHNHAPFIIDKNNGLTLKLIDYLNKNSEEFNFKLKVVPRSRLNYILKPWINKTCNSYKCKDNWLVLWVNHKWGFGKKSLKDFSWTPLLKDSNAIVSSKFNKIEYTKPSDLIGKVLAGTAGHKYLGIDDLVNDGKITRVNGSNEISNLQVVLANRADVTLLPKSAFDYYVKLNKDFENLYTSKIPHQKYMRNIMTNNKNTELINYLNSINLDIFN